MYFIISVFWPGFHSSFSHCSKCWNCCLFKLVTNHCMSLIPEHIWSCICICVLEIHEPFFLNLVYCMSISGVDKGTKCPSGFFWLLWRSFSSGILLHKHRNWPPYDNSCMFTTSLSCLVMFAKRWIKTITDWIAIDNFVLQIQLNPFRQPMVIEDSALFLPCYSNCFLFGIWAGLLFHLFQ